VVLNALVEHDPQRRSLDAWRRECAVGRYWTALVARFGAVVALVKPRLMGMTTKGPSSIFLAFFTSLSSPHPIRFFIPSISNFALPSVPDSFLIFVIFIPTEPRGHLPPLSSYSLLSLMFFSFLINFKIFTPSPYFFCQRASP
jgi:hypothetical protein